MPLHLHHTCMLSERGVERVMLAGKLKYKRVSIQVGQEHPGSYYPPAVVEIVPTDKERELLVIIKPEDLGVLQHRASLRLLPVHEWRRQGVEIISVNLHTRVPTDCMR
jgi:hypothetical protein